LILFFVFNIHSAEVKLELYDVQKPGNVQGVDAVAFVGEPFGIKVTVSGGNRNTGSIEVDGFDQLHIAGNNRSTSFAMINGNMSSETAQEYQVYADKEGTLTIGPAHVDHDGKKISSHSFKIHVIKRPEGTAPSQQQQGADQGAAGQGAELFCKLVAPKKTIVVGEPLELKLLIYYRGPVVDHGFAKQATFPGFKVKEVVQTALREEVKDSKTYIVQEKKLILFPLKPGEKTIEPVHFAYNVALRRQRQKSNGFFDDAFFQAFMGQSVEQRRTVSNGLEISVNPLPDSKHRVDAVGNFTRFQASVDKNEAVTNEPLIFSLELEGKADFERLATPKLRLPHNMKFYESKAEVHEDLSQTYSGGKKRFEFVIQISKPGTWEIPAQEFRYFDTAAGKYNVLHTAPISLVITQAQGETAFQAPSMPASSQSEQEKQDESGQQQKFEQDIHFIEEDLRTVQKNNYAAIAWWIFVLLLLLPLAVVRFAMLRKIFNQLVMRIKFGSPGHQQTFSLAQKKLAELEKTGNAKPLYQLIMTFLTVKFGVTADVMTENWLEHRLEQEGWTREKIDEFLLFMHGCASIYFSSAKMTEHQQRELLKRGHYWLLLVNKLNK